MSSDSPPAITRMYDEREELLRIALREVKEKYPSLYRYYNITYTLSGDKVIVEGIAVCKDNTLKFSMYAHKEGSIWKMDSLSLFDQ